MNPILLIGAGILLLGLGSGLGYWFAHSRHKHEANKVSDIQNELDDYRRHVTEHFGETVQHFQTIGQQYQSLYRHMAKGADALCDAAQSDALLGFAAGSAAVITANTVDETDTPAEAIKDYAPVEESEPPKAEPQVEAADTTEPPEPSFVPDDSTTEAPAEEVAEDLVATPTSVEAERTVH